MGYWWGRNKGPLDGFPFPPTLTRSPLERLISIKYATPLYLSAISRCFAPRTVLDSKAAHLSTLYFNQKDDISTPQMRRKPPVGHQGGRPPHLSSSDNAGISFATSIGAYYATSSARGFRFLAPCSMLHAITSLLFSWSLGSALCFPPFVAVVCMILLPVRS